MLRTGISALTTITLGMSESATTGAKSVIGLNGMSLYRLGLVDIAPAETNSV